MWEYKAIHLDDDELAPDKLTERLNELGKSGWELVSVMQRSAHGYTRGGTFLMKRPLSVGG